MDLSAEDYNFDSFTNEKFGGVLEFQGQHSFIKTVLVRDINQQIIKLSFSDHDTVSKLYQQYYLMSKNETRIKFVVCLTKKMAIDKNYVTCYILGKNLDEAIFEVVPEIEIGKYEQDKSLIDNQSRQIHIYVKLLSGKTVTVCINSSSTILGLKKKIHQLQNIPYDQLRLIFQGKQLFQNVKIQRYGIMNQSTVHIVIRLRGGGGFSIDLESVKQYFKGLFGKIFGKRNNQPSNFVLIKQDDYKQAIVVSYKEVKDMKVTEIIKRFICFFNSYWTFMLKDFIFSPHDELNVIEKNNLLNKQEYTELKIFKNGRFLFFSTIRQLQFKQNLFPLKIAKILDMVAKKKAQLVKNKLNHLLPIVYYSCNQFYRQLNSYLRDFKLIKNENIKNIQYNLCCSLTKSLQQLPNFIGTVHRGMSNFYASKFCHQNSVYIFPSFTSTSKKQEIAKKFMTDKTDAIKGTLFHLNSLTGKDIQEYSVFKNEEQVLFLPFTCFFVDKIRKYQKYEQVWLTQIATPTSFNKQIVLWIDDKPQKNVNTIQKLRKSVDRQILQIPGTKIAQLWKDNLMALIMMKRINLKIITNMVRIQDGDKINYEAGLDLVEKFKGDKKSIPVIIYCGDVKKAEETAKNRFKEGLRITNDPEQVLQFLK